jgi:hypothetical protein
MKAYLIILVVVLGVYTSTAQTPKAVATLIDSISGRSEMIASDIQVMSFIGHGIKVLPILAELFTDTTPSKIYSECCKRLLLKGEIAIILADRIAGMPYFLLTGIENCTLQFCPNNPNRIEFYLNAIYPRGRLPEFKEKYVNWLSGVINKKN